MKTAEEAPWCHDCDLETVPVPGRHRTWTCPVCRSVCTRQTIDQSGLKSLALLDQLLAAEERPEVRQKIKDRIADQEAFCERQKVLRDLGVQSSDIESWVFSPKEEE